ncbi:MAG TPA: aminotransferase class V-fold PLP-dependent enzyme [Spirochaetota bacterium]
MKSWNEIANEFPINERYLYLNNCGTSTPPRSVVDDVKQRWELWTHEGAILESWPHGEKDNARKILSRLIDCAFDEVTLIHNTAEGMIFTATGLDLKDRDEIILLEKEYPSNVYPWKAHEQKGVKIIFVKLHDSPREQGDAVIAAITPRTRAISMSAVHWCTGLPLPLEQIGNECNRRGIFFAVDGSQGIGHIPISMKSAYIDAMSFCGWKFLLGPPGIGGLAVRKESLSKLSFPFKGPHSVPHPGNYQEYQDALIDSADRYAYSTPSLFDTAAFSLSLTWLDTIGFDNVMNRIHDLSQIIVTRLSSDGFIVPAAGYTERTSIICARHPVIQSDLIIKDLAAHGIIARERAGYIRMAPHIYQNEEMMEQACEIISRYANREPYIDNLI